MSSRYREYQSGCQSTCLQEIGIGKHGNVYQASYYSVLQIESGLQSYHKCGTLGRVRSDGHRTKNGIPKVTEYRGFRNGITSCESQVSTNIYLAKYVGNDRDHNGGSDEEWHHCRNC